MSQRNLAFKWGLYAVVSLLFLLLQQFVLVHIRLLNVHPFLLPLLVAAVTTLEQPHQAAGFSLGLGVCCDLLFSPPFPFFYTLVFFVSALLCMLIAERLIAARFFCCLICGALSLLLTGWFHSLLQMYSYSTPFSASGSLMLRELLLSIPLLLVVYPLFALIHRKTKWD